MHSLPPQHHTVFTAGRLSSVFRPVCLGPQPYSRAAPAAARHSVSTAAGARHTGARSSARCAATNADGHQDDGSPQQRRQNTAPSAPKPAAPKPTRASHTRVKDVPWDAATEAAVLQFWTEQGALLLEAEVQPEQQAEQRRLRSKIVKWAARHSRHRDLEFLGDYMARVRDAAAASSWADDPWRLALFHYQVIAHNNCPANLLRRIQAAERELAKQGIRLTQNSSLFLAGYGILAGRVVKLLPVLDQLGISLDVADVVTKAPGLLNLDNPKAVLERRFAALQQLHPQLDVARVLSGQPSLLANAEKTLAANWASLQMASGLGNDDVRAVVQYNPSTLSMSSDVMVWRIQQLRAYDLARKHIGAGHTPASGIARVLSAASFRVWRLRYLCGAGTPHRFAEGWVKMGEEDFAARNPGYSRWLASHPIPPEAYRS